jgi:hypothetical protein
VTSAVSFLAQTLFRIFICGKHMAFLAGFLSRSDPVDLNFSVSLLLPLVLGIVFREN